MRTLTIMVLLTAVAGCGDIGAPRRKARTNVAGTGLVDTNTNAPAAPAQAVLPPAASVPAQPAGNAQAGGLPGLPGVNLPGQPQAGSPNTVTVPAQPGVTGKGNYGPGIITTPISVYFQAQERLIFDQVTYALKLYEAEHGSKPKTEGEFMQRIIQANNIRLPKLPEGSKYKYDPQKGELMVEQPQ